MKSPYSDSILDLLSDGEPRTVAEIREGIDAPDGAGIKQLLQRLMWNLAVDRDRLKLVSEIKKGKARYALVSRNPKFPGEFTKR